MKGLTHYTVCRGAMVLRTCSRALGSGLWALGSGLWGQVIYDAIDKAVVIVQASINSNSRVNPSKIKYIQG